MPRDKHDHESEKKSEIKSGDHPTELLSHPSYQELMKQLDEAEQKASQYWERILRMQADNDNVLRRTERDVANAHKYALEKFAADLIPIIDSLELCITNTPVDQRKVAASVIEGVDLTLKMFYTVMEKFGIKQISPLSEPFNPEFQQAISMQQDITVAPGTVLSVLQKGYTLNNRLLRPALVVVSKAD